LAELLAAAGVEHPGDLRPHHIVRRISASRVSVLSALFPDLAKGELLEGKYSQTIFRVTWPMAQAESFAPLYSLSAALSGLGGPPHEDSGPTVVPASSPRANASPEAGTNSAAPA